MVASGRIYEGFVPGRHLIDAYGNGGFRFAEMSHRGSILALPSGVKAWPVAIAWPRSREAPCADVFAEAGRHRIAAHRDRTRMIRPSRALRWRVPRCADRSRRHADWSGSAHLQHPAGENRKVGAALIAVRVTHGRYRSRLRLFAIVKPSCARATRTAIWAALFAPADKRPHLFALYAFNFEIARIRDSVREAAARRNPAAMVAGRAAGRGEGRRSRPIRLPPRWTTPSSNSACRAKPWSI